MTTPNRNLRYAYTMRVSGAQAPQPLMELRAPAPGRDARKEDESPGEDLALAAIMDSLGGHAASMIFEIGRHVIPNIDEAGRQFSRPNMPTASVAPEPDKAADPRAAWDLNFRGSNNDTSRKLRTVKLDGPASSPSFGWG